MMHPHEPPSFEACAGFRMCPGAAEGVPLVVANRLRWDRCSAEVADPCYFRRVAIGLGQGQLIPG